MDIMFYLPDDLADRLGGDLSCPDLPQFLSDFFSATN
jgi:hypothetical protein